MKEKFIPAIYNYCDRWCERCRFITRCQVGAEEVRRMDKGEDKAEDAMGIGTAVAENLQKALELLEKFAKDKGIDLSSLPDEPMNEPVYTDQQEELKEWGRNYIQTTDSWFNENESLFAEKEVELNRNYQLGIQQARVAAELVNAIEVVRWFLFFISVKIDRALYGRQKDFGFEEDPIQNDANGSAKVALEAIQRSLSSWEVIRTNFPEQTDDLIDIFLILGKMRKAMMQLFPHVEQFIRPGFDEPDLD